MISNIITNIRKTYFTFIACIITFLLLQNSTNSTKFIHSIKNPFSEFILADRLGGITRLDVDIIDSKWELFTVRKPTLVDNQDDYLVYIKYNHNFEKFLVKESEMKANKTFIESGDLIYFTSQEFPLLILIGISSEYNPIFDMNIKGMVHIEEAFNVHLKHHPMDFKQQIEMMNWEENEMNISHMGYIYNSNDEIMDHDFKIDSNNAGMTERISDMFLEPMPKEIIHRKVKKWTKKGEKRLTKIFQDFLKMNIESQDINEIFDPNDDTTSRLNELYLKLMSIMNLVMNNQERILEFEYDFFLAIVEIEKKYFHAVERLLVDSSINLFMNPLVYEMPRNYFPTEVEINGNIFTSKYADIFIEKFLKKTPLEIKSGGFGELLEEMVEDCKKEYAIALEDLKLKNRRDHSSQFEEELDKFFIHMMTPFDLIYMSLRLKLKSAMFYYMDRMVRISQVRDSGLIDTHKFVNILNLIEIMKYFGPDRSASLSGYPVDFKVFEIAKKHFLRTDTLEELMHS